MIVITLIKNYSAFKDSKVLSEVWEDRVEKGVPHVYFEPELQDSVDMDGNPIQIEVNVKKVGYKDVHYKVQTNELRSLVDSYGGKTYKVSADNQYSIALMNDVQQLQFMKENPLIEIWSGSFFEFLPHWRRKVVDGVPQTHTVMVPQPDLADPQWNDTYDDEGNLIEREPVLDEEGEQVINYIPQPDIPMTVNTMEWHIPDEPEKMAIYKACWPYYEGVEVDDGQGGTVFKQQTLAFNRGMDWELFEPNSAKYLAMVAP